MEQVLASGWKIEETPEECAVGDRDEFVLEQESEILQENVCLAMRNHEQPFVLTYVTKPKFY
ncbi:MAG: hypothetical protein HFI75_03750 [Lachnospiraceae bacterium]|nr:hypothetical protein [Lachnospiraceae bacterium]